MPNAPGTWCSNCWNCANQATGFMPHRASSSSSVASSVPSSPASFVVVGVSPARHNPAGQRPHNPQVFGYRYGDEVCFVDICISFLADKTSYISHAFLPHCHGSGSREFLLDKKPPTGSS